tara:strand:+ start:1460 stop:3190 length:1731 start_codon:yes stop_codon:yes gene_type:complete
MGDEGACIACGLVAENDANAARYAIDRDVIDPSQRGHHDQSGQQGLPKKPKKKKARRSYKERIEDEVEAKVLPEKERQERAAAELVNREQSRRFLLPFIERFNPTYKAGWFHKDLCRRLEKFSDDVYHERSPRLMLFVPPRHGKSLTTTQNFPAWHLGHHPNHEFITTAYAGSLANTFSRHTREIISDPAYEQVFKHTALKGDSKSAEHWELTKGGGLLAAGVGGPVTGNGAHILIIDDPVKNAEEAESETVRESVWNWYITTAYTRLAPGGGVLLIMTRWNYDDLAGRLLDFQKMSGDKWDVVEYPALALADEEYRYESNALHPERYNEDALKRIRGVVGERTWWSLYQQKPSPDEGAYFKREYFRYYTQLPPLHTLNIYCAWDLAVGTKQRNDYTVCIVVGVDHLDRIYVIDVFRDKIDSDGIIKKIIATQRNYKPQMQGMENGVIELTINPLLQKALREQKPDEDKVSINFHAMKIGRQDKEARARPIQGRMGQGMVFFPKNAGWIEPFESELLQFPQGKHDDQVDTMAWIGQMFPVMSKHKPRGKDKLTGWREKLAKMGKLKHKSHRSAMAA